MSAFKLPLALHRDTADGTPVLRDAEEKTVCLAHFSTMEQVAEILVAVNNREALIAALEKQVAWRKANTQRVAAMFGQDYHREFLVHGASGVARKLEQESEAALAAAKGKASV